MDALTFNERIAYTGDSSAVVVQLHPLRAIPFLVEAIVDTGAAVSLFDKALALVLVINDVTARRAGSLSSLWYCSLEEAAMESIELTSEIWQEGNMYVAYCHELDVVTAGRTLEEARKNVAEAVEIFFEEAKRKGTLKTLLEEAGFAFEEGSVISPRARFCSFEKLNFSNC